MRVTTRSPLIFTLLGIVALIAALAASLMFGGSAVAVVGASPPEGRPGVIHVLGIANLGGQQVLVDIAVVVPAGQKANEAARRALEQQGARPFDSASLGSEGFTLTGLVWNDPSPPVVQNYNPGSSKTEDEPDSLNENGHTALTNTHGTWDGVTTSSFDIISGGITDRCPSLVRECRGRQSFDGNNDVAWLELAGNTLGVAWYGTSIDEVDIALNTGFDWNDGCADAEDSFDAQTVFLHENGHLVGLGHSDDTNAVMFPFYQTADCTLGTDDEEGVTFLYDSNTTGSVSGTVTDNADPVNAIEGASVVLEGTGLSATTAADGSYTITNIPDPVTYTVNVSQDGFESATILRLTVDGPTTADDFALVSTGDGGGGGGGLTGALTLDITNGPDHATQGKTGQQYENKDRVHIFVTVEQEDAGIEGAAVHLRIVTPNPQTDLVADGTTGANGVWHLHYKVNAGRDGTDTYHIEADASKDQGSGSCTHADGACHADFDVS